MANGDSILKAIGLGVAGIAVFAVTIMVILVVLGVGAGGQADSPDVETRTIAVVHRPLDEVVLPVIVDRLDPTTVLTLRAVGFEPDTTGSVRQCRSGERRSCRNSQPVRFDGSGAANFQYLVTDGGGCRLRDERCTVELRSGESLAIIDTVFVDEAPPPGRVTVTPRRDLLPGETVTVSVSGFAGGTTLNLMACASPSTRGPRCGAPGPELTLTTDSNGAASAEVILDVREVGADRVACGRRVACTMVVNSDEAVVRALPVKLHFNESPGARYDAGRTAIGVGAALAFLLGALVLVRSTNWMPPPEADGRAIDDADYADLDLEAEQFGPETMETDMESEFRR